MEGVNSGVPQFSVGESSQEMPEVLRRVGKMYGGAARQWFVMRRRIIAGGLR